MKRTRKQVVLAIGVVFCLSLVIIALAQDKATVQIMPSNTYGNYLANAEGMSLYLYTSDSKGASTCTGDCATTWPPLTTAGQPLTGKLAGAKGKLGTIKRSDGSMQVTYNGMPLYTYSGDQKSGDTNGEGLGGVWYLVSPQGTAIKSKVAPSGGAASGGASGGAVSGGASGGAMSGGSQSGAASGY
jgi:predicted lipoprotein with Yx(FWY)xxD motif